VLLQINNNIIREKIEYIDETRKNEINGSNATFYVKNWEGKYISDYNYDLTINTSDVSVISVDSSGTETELTVSSITYDDGKIILSSAPSDVDLYITYAYSYFDPDTPNPILKLAVEYLAASYAYMRINSSQKKQVKFGNVSITNGTGEDSAYFFMYNKYMDIIRQLNDNLIGGAIWGESLVKI